ncbi:MoaD/ThiS family protein [Niveibacterium sp. SC-1]|uniref:MoaD/ThiS family protein n=1 Tax=Niveibacterium sp. SC-1 TaxID=3135646 RepID=UPI00311ECFCC
MRVTVRLPTHLDLYTGGERTLSLTLAPGACLRDALAGVEARHPGLRFRIVDEQGAIRRHIKIFVGNAVATGLAQPLAEGETVMVVAALSGG